MARIRLNQPVVKATAQRLTLPLMRRTGQEILAGAKQLAPEGDHVSGSGAPSKSVPLKFSITSSQKMTLQEIRIQIGSMLDHAATVHQGSKPHTIRSASGKMLKFRWDRGDFLVAARSGRRRGNRRTGSFHYFVRVRHPGNKRPVQYLVRPLLMFGRLNGFRVTATRTVNRTFLP